MNTHINQILDKYWAGESTLQEEKEIKSYFASGDIADEHKAFAPMFGLFTMQQEDSYNKDLSSVLESTLSKEAEGVPVRDTEVAPSSGAKVFQFRKLIMAAAAVFAIVMAAVIVMDHDSTPAESTPKMASNVIILDGSDDSEEALRVTKEALAFLSGKLKKNGKNINSGIQNLDKINVVN